MPGIEAGGSRANTSAERFDGVADECADVVTTRAVLAFVANKAAAARQFIAYSSPRAGFRSLNQSTRKCSSTSHLYQAPQLCASCFRRTSASTARTLNHLSKLPH